jgi:hypothetical protein
METIGILNSDVDTVARSVRYFGAVFRIRIRIYFGRLDPDPAEQNQPKFPIFYLLKFKSCPLEPRSCLIPLKDEKNEKIKKRFATKLSFFFQSKVSKNPGAGSGSALRTNAASGLALKLVRIPTKHCFWEDANRCCVRLWVGYRTYSILLKFNCQQKQIQYFIITSSTKYSILLIFLSLISFSPV